MPGTKERVNLEKTTAKGGVPVRICKGAERTVGSSAVLDGSIISAEVVVFISPRRQHFRGSGIVTFYERGDAVVGINDQGVLDKDEIAEEGAFTDFRDRMIGKALGYLVNDHCKTECRFYEGCSDRDDVKAQFEQAVVRFSQSRV